MGKDKISRIEREKRIIEVMIRLYCRRKEGNEALCPECAELLEYARTRLSHCPFGEHKTSCKRCSVHCYSPKMRERVRNVMRFSGPRMLFYSPRATLEHLFRS
ncbi:nitrous oxide-stimulated promoter family protein [uncultured Sanguibacteroides sp.]|uniref:nitrous oxide-stimulated promoter family protein n=1 Tax=uncultured Sanguibacteroides sp. TaxID=1635151 RepID=UPI0025EC5C58|nr:nitrous oxide-stimulated promoter family protein [uncultured Sanguibacteroides sp.]